MEPDLESGYIKMYMKRKKTPKAYKDTLGKQSKLPWTITLSSELKFEQMNSHWKSIEEKKTYIHPKF
jgi:hypothetical protein